MSTSQLSDPKYALVADVHQWIIAKLTTGEGFSVLLASNHPSGKKLTKYQHDSVEEALAQCKNELSSVLLDASAYALVFDTRTMVSHKLEPMLMFQMEDKPGRAAIQFAQRYEWRKKFLSKALEYKPLEEFRATGRGEPWLQGMA